MANNRQIDLAFKIAGYTQGRPTEDNTTPPVFPNDYTIMIELWDDDVVNQLLLESGEDPTNRTESINPAFPYIMAGNILTHVMNAGVTTEGRDTSVTQSTAGGLTTVFQSARTYKETLQDRVAQLQSKARLLQAGPLPSFRVTPNPNPGPTPDPTPSNLDFNTISGYFRGGDNVSVDTDSTNNTITISAPYDIRAVDGFGDAVYDSLKLTLKTDNNVIVRFNDSREEVSFETEIDKQTLHDPLKTVLKAGNNVTLTPDDVNDTITISATGGSSSGNTPAPAGDLSSVLAKTSELVVTSDTYQNIDSRSHNTRSWGFDQADSEADAMAGRASGSRWWVRATPLPPIPESRSGRVWLIIRLRKGDDPLNYRLKSNLTNDQAGIFNGADWNQATRTDNDYDYYWVTYFIRSNTDPRFDIQSREIETRYDGVVTQEGAYDAVKAIFNPGAGITLNESDTARTIRPTIDEANLQTYVIRSANQGSAPTNALWGKLLAVAPNDSRKLQFVDPPTPSSGGSSYTPPDDIRMDFAYSNGTRDGIDYLRSDHINAVFGDLSKATSTRRKDIRLGFRGYLDGFQSVNDVRSVIIAGITVRGRTVPLTGEFADDGFFNLYGEVTNGNLTTIMSNQTTGSTRVAISYLKGGTTLTSHSVSIPWLTAAQQTSSPLAPYIPSSAIIGGVGGNGGGSASFTRAVDSNGVGTLSISNSSGTGWRPFIRSQYYDTERLYFISTSLQTSSKRSYGSVILPMRQVDFAGSRRLSFMVENEEVYLRFNSSENRVEGQVLSPLPSGSVIFATAYYLS